MVDPYEAAIKLLSECHQGPCVRVSAVDVRAVVNELQRLREYERKTQRIPHLGQKEGAVT